MSHAEKRSRNRQRRSAASGRLPLLHQLWSEVARVVTIDQARPARARQPTDAAERQRVRSRKLYPFAFAEEDKNPSLQFRLSEDADAATDGETSTPRRSGRHEPEPVGGPLPTRASRKRAPTNRRGGTASSRG